MASLMVLPLNCPTVHDALEARVELFIEPLMRFFKLEGLITFWPAGFVIESRHDYPE